MTEGQRLVYVSAYEALIERCALASVRTVAGAPEARDADVIVLGILAVLDEVRHTLECVTPAMWDALPPRALDFNEAYLAMLRASALYPKGSQ